MTLLLVMAIFTSITWTKDLGFYHNLFLCRLHYFILKHILHIIILKIIYDLMSNITANMTRIFHKPLYFNLLSCNLKNYRNMVFLPFDSIGFNIMICPMTICTIHSCFFWNYLRFLSWYCFTTLWYSQTIWRAPKSRGETHLRVSQSQVTESWDLEARSRLPTLKRG